MARKAPRARPLLAYFAALVGLILILNTLVSIHFHSILLGNGANNYHRHRLFNFYRTATDQTYLLQTEFPPRISPDLPLPSAEEIFEVLKKERTRVDPEYKTDDETLMRFANAYELTYAFMAAFERNGIAVFLGFGSQLGARRHHGIIPFGDKDVDLTVFSTDEERVFSIINSTLSSKNKWSEIKVGDATFGFQLVGERMGELSDYYLDFWMYGDRQGKQRNQISCVGRQMNNNRAKDSKFKRYFGSDSKWHRREKEGLKEWLMELLYLKRVYPGCENYYSAVHMKKPPIFDWEDHFPPLYQVFGSHRVAIPAKSCEIETFGYGHEKDWNVTCGGHRQWIKGHLSSHLTKVPKEKRQCEPLYDKFPFVFSMGNGTEQLKQGNVVLHQSNITITSLPCRNN